VTGASGFIGSHLVHKLSFIEEFSVTGVVHRQKLDHPKSIVTVKIQNLNKSGLFEKLSEINIVIHLAAKTYDSGRTSLAGKEGIEKINVDATLNLARQAAEHDVNRFIFVSTVKVNGEQTLPNHPFTEYDVPQPENSYSLSKWEAEKGLNKIAQETGMEVVIIRPPLVYGPGVKGNFASLMRLVATGLPLPLGGIDNKRSLVGLENLVDFIVTCIEHPAAANQTFFVSDGNDLSSSEVLMLLAKAMGKPSRILPVPSSLLEAGANLFGKKGISQRLLGSLQVDISKARSLLGWRPAASVEEELARCVKKNPLKKRKLSCCFMRFFDVVFSAGGLVICLPIFVVIMILGWYDTGSPLFFQERVGRYKKPFVLVKFRTMRLGTASVASHLVSFSSVTKLGRFLRRTKLDELPQLWNVLKGEMSLVGPRPCLFNQRQLIKEREMRNVLDVRPGITGLAQVNEIDMSTPELLAETDAKMICQMSGKKYFMFILQTITGKGAGDRVKNPDR
jgi:lipopolysaccharide/colanic/teichoic acid biosynthesis glycosyltransferase/dTDP-4-dehydrorhamnose reductase